MMDPNMTSNSYNRQLNRMVLPSSGRTLVAVLILALALVLVSSVALASPADLDRAREADTTRWVALGRTTRPCGRRVPTACPRYVALAAADAARLEQSASAVPLATSPKQHPWVTGSGQAIQPNANPSMDVAQWYGPAVASAAGQNSYALNPELLIASRYSSEAAGSMPSNSFYALNPELLIAGRYRSEAAGSMPSNSFYAMNPELLIASRYAPSLAASPDDNVLSLNPELISVRAWRAQAPSLLCNPESLSC